MEINLPASVRQIVYIIVVMGTAIVVPLDSLNLVNDAVIVVWSSVSGAASLLASLNVNKVTK